MDSNEVLNVRPLLRRDTVLLRRNGGAFLTTEHTTAKFAGESAYQLLARLRPHLTGERSLAQICAGLGGAQRATVSAVVSGLLDRGIVLDLGPDTLEPDVANRFEAQIGYLAHLVDAPAQSFSRFREARILLLGNGVSLDAAAAGLVRNGAANLTVSQGSFRGYDLVLYCADRDGAAPLTDLIRSRQAGDPALLALATADGWAILGPVTRSGTPGCWCCAHARLAADGTTQLTPTVARMLGGALAFNAFRLLTGVPSDDDQGAVVQNLRTLQADWLSTADGCPVCAAAGPVTPIRPQTPAPVVRTVDDLPSTTVAEYAAAVHNMIRTPLPPMGHVPNWDDRPAVLTTYPEAPLLPLSAISSTRDSLGWLLRMSYGPLSRRLRFDSSQSGRTYRHYPTTDWRRGAVSGGGLYPLEIYCVAGESGIYHYAPGHHAFEHLTDGDATEVVRQAVRHPDADRADQFLLITLRFWRNAFKYASLGYHIGTIDTGALLETLTRLAAEVGTPIRRLLWFDDEPLNTLLGLDPAEESVLAVVPLPWKSTLDTSTSAGPSAPFEASRAVLRFAWTQRIHRTTVLSGQSRPAPVAISPPPRGFAIALPPPTPVAEPVSALLQRRRSSFGSLAAMPPLALQTLGTVLAAAIRPSRNDLTPDDEPAGWTSLSVLSCHVADLKPGGYRYSKTTHTLHPTKLPGPQWPGILARIGVRLVNYNLDEAAAIFAISGPADALLSHYGPRGYRLLSAEVGSVVQAAYLAATAAGLGCGAVLNLDHETIDEVLGFEGTGERTVLCFLLGGEHRGSADFDHRLT